ncbi:MAG: Nif3-like dinuclear metal center hexameric protein [Candidatus Marinimicrobia bacterium]|nr:Nif3-like dinuclear metal center hexameric protein [Candidatus Neomarinimicrobiota bacterium]
MVKRQELNDALKQLLRYEDYEDYSLNGLQIEGCETIKKIAFAVSYNLLSVKAAIENGADALIVHHGIFGKNFFSVTGREKIKVKALLDANVSLFGIHLPLDGHRELGNNAQLAACISADIIEPFEIGFIVKNTAKLTRTEILDTFHCKLGTDDEGNIVPNGIKPGRTYGIDHLDFGPEVPEKIAIVSGGSGSYYEPALTKNIDTFIGGDIREHIPAIAYESKTNYINLGHYWSETLGIKALQTYCEKIFDIETVFININNRI